MNDDENGRHPCEEGFNAPQKHDYLTLDKLIERGAGHEIAIYRCTLCGKRWHIEEDVGYHFPTYRIRPA